MMRHQILFGLTALLFAIMSAACESNPAAQQELDGMWGGDGIELEFLESGAAVTYDCGEGRIQEPVVTDENGKFEANGYIIEMGGPEPVGGFPKIDAHYSGEIDNSRMTLTVKRLDTGEEIGSFELQSGKPGKLFDCL